MMRLSTSRNRTLFSNVGAQPDPPLASVLEQCFWGEATNQYFYIDKYNDQRCESNNTGKKQFCKQRPSTTQGRINSSNIRVTGEKMPRLDKHDIDLQSEEGSDNSRCSTPEFMQKIYSSYSQLDVQSPLLLRRPVASLTESIYADEQTDFEDVTCNKENCDKPLVSMILNDENKPEPTQSCKEDKRHVKVAIDIPVCEKYDGCHGDDSDWKDKNELPDIPEEAIVSTVETHSELGQHDKAKIRLKSPSKTKRKLKSGKRKQHIKKKMELNTITVDYNVEKSEEQTNNSTQETPQTIKKSWKHVDDDVVTQMSTLNLSLNDDNLCLIPRQKSCPQILLNGKKRQFFNFDEENLATKKHQANQEEYVSRNGRRRIPIQIISDPFKCTGSRSASQLRDINKPRPHSASPSLTKTNRQKTTSCWK